MANTYWRTFSDYLPLPDLVARLRSAGLQVEPLERPDDGGLVARHPDSDAWLRVHYWVPYLMVLCHGDDPTLRDAATAHCPLLGDWSQGPGASRPDDEAWLHDEYAAIALDLFGPFHYTASVTADMPALIAQRPMTFHEYGTPTDAPDATETRWCADADAIDLGGDVVLELRRQPSGAVEVTVTGDAVADRQFALKVATDWLVEAGSSTPEWHS